MLWYPQTPLSFYLLNLFQFMPTTVQLHKGVLYIFHGEYENPYDLRWQPPALRRLLGKALYLGGELLALALLLFPWAFSQRSAHCEN